MSRQVRIGQLAEYWDSPASLTRQEIERWNHGTSANEVPIICLRMKVLEPIDILVATFVNQCLPTETVSWETLGAEAQAQVNIFRVSRRDELGFQEGLAYVANEDNAFTHSFHNWRYLMFRTLYAVHEPYSDSARLEKIISRELDLLIKLRNQSSSNFQQHLKAMVDYAIDYNFRVLPSKASISIEIQDPGTRKLSNIPFKNGPNFMKKFSNLKEWHKSVDGRCTDFIARLGLRIYGDAPTMQSTGTFAARYHRDKRRFVEYHKGVFEPMKVYLDQFPEQDTKDAAMEEGDREKPK
ncbi:Fc.00g083260.m01.CDS01 [Cosmosporella sp. VM-42]